jgi:hypothetical protein
MHACMHACVYGLQASVELFAVIRAAGVVQELQHGLPDVLVTYCLLAAI